MSSITWRNSYSIGIRQLDDQHKKLIEIINSLYQAHQGGMGQALVSEVLDALVEYTEYHFSMEEDLQKQYKYPGLEDNHEEHREFISKIADLQQEGRRGNLLLSLKTIDYLKDWTINHILGTDKDFGEFVEGKELG